MSTYRPQWHGRTPLDSPTESVDYPSSEDIGPGAPTAAALTYHLVRSPTDHGDFPALILGGSPTALIAQVCPKEESNIGKIWDHTPCSARKMKQGRNPYRWCQNKAVTVSFR